MRILFDAYWWVDGQPSGRRVVDSLLRTWAEEWPEDELTAAVPQRHLDRAAMSARGLPVTLRPLRLWPHGLSVMSELAFLAADVDAVVAQNFTPLGCRALRATFVHDMMYVERPEFFSRLERLYFAAMPWSARLADLVLTSTAAEAARISRVRPHLADRVRPIGLSVPDAFRRGAARDPAVGLDSGHFVLCVGRLNVRKNLDRLIEAVVNGGLVTPDCPLVVVGEPNGVRLRPAAAEDQRRIRFLGGVDDAGLKWLYEHCRLFVFPSLDEGFGLPVAEAALSGAAMALSDIPAFRELAPDAVFFDPTDVRSIRRAVGAQLTSPELPPQVMVPTWSEVVSALRSHLSAALSVGR